MILVHAFCNWRGLPRFWGRVTREDDDGAETIIGPDIGGAEDNDNGSGKRNEDGPKSAATGELGVAWTVAYYIVLVVGAVSWKKLLWTLTETSSSLALF